ncbi:GTPase HflX [Eubacteriales bacterium OttesenSCG-928-A19]|nr:GTPase HflX [Eubacteriales bacterium OttesenSCG-928-A19]
MINGNTDGIRASLLTEMDALYTMEFDEELFAPPELIALLARFSTQVRREISVYLSRSGDVMDVTIGDVSSVPLAEMHLRRSLDRLAGVRCIHTHPGGYPDLSDVDIQALVNLRLDAMASIGVLNDQATGIQAAFLGERVHGVPQPELTGVIAISQIPQAEWMARIAESDRILARTVSETDTDRPERAILLGIESMESLEELRALAETAGAEVVELVLQKRDKPDNATYIGTGKAQQLSLEAQAKDCDLIIVDDELSGAQTRNLEQAIGFKIIDRTTLILDIFAQRAQSRAGKLQVEMAQLSYQLPRLIGEGVSMSRLGAGIGTRGPGETKLEISRRRIRKRLSDLKEEIADLSRQRNTQRARRERHDVPVVALVGYTNTGKSSLLNLLSDAGVMAENKLFVTLDPVTRRVPLPEGGSFLLVDTVGFIRKLPHALVDAFRSTLEEALLADLLVIVSDASSPDVLAQHDVVLQVLGDLGAGDKPVLDVLNKIDIVDELPLTPGAIPISVKEKRGIDTLLDAIAQRLMASQRTVSLLIPYAKGACLSRLHEEATVLTESFEADGTLVKARMDQALLDRMLATLGEDALRPSPEVG